MTSRRLSLALLSLALPVGAQTQPAVDWAFTPLTVQEPPTVQAVQWNGGAIDRFVGQGLQAAGLPGNAIADQRTLIRRATFVLTGLPPTPTEVATFLADASESAFANVVDRLLASPHYGEHQARHWLDLARYSDSNGLDENLAFANAFRYRDWVVAAHNQDLPYDRFVQMQLAGDLMVDDPQIALDGHLATGFLALGPRMLAEQDKEKLVLDTIDEQIDLIGRTVLGLTIGCARCHDHKFDPISQRDYYALAGVFRSTKTFRELGHVSTWFDRELATDAAIAARKTAEKARDEAASALEHATATAVETQRRTLVADAGRYLLAGSELLAKSYFVEAEQATATSLHADGKHWGDADTVVLHTHMGGEQFAEWTLAVARTGRYRLAVRYAAEQSRPMRVAVDGVLALQPVLVATTGGWQPQHQQWHEASTLELAAGSRSLRLVSDSQHVPHLDALLLTPAGEDHGNLLPNVVHQAATALAVRTAHPVLSFWRDLTADGDAGFVARAAAQQGKGGLAAILLGGMPPTNARELAARLQTFFATAAAAAAAKNQANEQKEKKDTPIRLDEPLLEAARALLFDHGGLLALANDALRPYLPATTLAELQQLTAALDATKSAVPPRAPTAMCVAEDAVKDLPVHFRGNHLTLAAVTTPRAVLSVFASFVPPPTMPSDRSGRLEFARWLFLPEQALAARVQANRLWQRAFGQGLVRSPSNFGRRGDVPTHSALLDWLAADLRAHGWSQKHLWRALLLSRTWQQTCGGSDEATLHDPENRLLSHQQRQRLQAESIRDAMLAVAGSLDRSLGGSLLSTEDRGYVTNDQSGDAARYDATRRSLYLPIIRNAMFDLFAAFDYADPSVHLEQRPQTAVATQALWLLNAPMVRQQSKAFAARALAAAANDADRITFLWQEALVRAPSPRERDAAQLWLTTMRATGLADEAFVGLAQALFASNEFVYVD